VTDLRSYYVGYVFDLLGLRMPRAAQVSLFAALAFVGGVGAVYAPVPTFTAVAATFALALWWFIRGQGRPGSPVSKSVKQKSKPRSTLATKFVSVYLLLWWLALIAPIATYAPRVTSSVDVSSAVAQGSLQRQVLVLSFGLVGALFLPTAMKRFDLAFRWVVALWALYLCWAFASLSWSIYPPLTIRSVGAFALVSVGAFGLGAGFYGSLPNGRDLFLRHVFMAGVLSALVVLIPLPLHWDEYDLLDPSQRLSIGEGVSMTTYVVRPVMCALLALAATQMLGVRRWRKRDWLWVTVLVLPLLALKARGPILWGILALAVFYLFSKTQLRDRLWQAGLLLVIGIGTYVYSSAGTFSWLAPYLTRGNVENTESLTGRIPLWEVLQPYIAEHPWLGVGFAAFWSPEHVYLIEQLVGWTAPSAHNGYLEELLNTGVMGLAILLTFFFHTLVVVVRKARRGDPFGWLAFLFLLYYLLLNVTNTLIQQYLEVPLIIVLAMLSLMSSKPMTYSSTLRREAPGAAQEPVGSTR
jgi:exopolysaccharide production protein ExoQ